jgi:hypothetical protein
MKSKIIDAVNESMAEIKAHPEILKEALEETMTDFEKVQEEIKLVMEIAELALSFFDTVSARNIPHSNSVRAASSRVYERLEVG